MLTDTSCVWEWGEIHAFTKYLLFVVQLYGRRLKYVLVIKYGYRNTAHDNWNNVIFLRKKNNRASNHKKIRKTQAVINQLHNNHML